MPRKRKPSRKRVQRRRKSATRAVKLGRKRPRVDPADGTTVAIAMRDTARARALAADLHRKSGHTVTVLSSPQAVSRLVRRPTILVLEVAAEGENGAALRELAREAPELRIVAVGRRDGDPLLLLESGALAVVGEDGNGEDVTRAVLALVKGEVVLDPPLAAVVVRRLQELARLCGDDGIDPQRCALLTKRERDVCQLLARGLSNEEISAELGVSVGTVKTHVHKVLQKLDVGDRGTAGAYWRLYRQSGPGKAGPA